MEVNFTSLEEEACENAEVPPCTFIIIIIVSQASRQKATRNRVKVSSLTRDPVNGHQRPQSQSQSSTTRETQPDHHAAPALPHQSQSLKPSLALVNFNNP